MKEEKLKIEDTPDFKRNDVIDFLMQIQCFALLAFSPCIEAHFIPFLAIFK